MSKQGLSLVVHYYVKPRGLGNCGESYLARNAIAYNMGAKVIGPMTAEGMNLELLEKNLYTYRPKLILLSALT